MLYTAKKFKESDYLESSETSKSKCDSFADAENVISKDLNHSPQEEMA